MMILYEFVPFVHRNVNSFVLDFIQGFTISVTLIQMPRSLRTKNEGIVIYIERFSKARKATELVKPQKV